MNRRDKKRLLGHIFLAVLEAFSRPNQHEPQLVANLVWYLPYFINRLSLSNGNSVKTGGVFVHAQPFVKVDNFPEAAPQSVELGDLLLLRTAYLNNQPQDYRAMLLQAKKVDRIPTLPDNKNQHHLYANWPIFEYTRASRHLNGKRRHLQGPDLYNAAKYLLISTENTDQCEECHTCSEIFHDRYFCCHQLLTAHPSLPLLSHYYCFAIDLLNFILGTSGKSYTPDVHHAETGWNMVIKDLTMITAHKHSTFVKRASQEASKERGAGSSTFFVCGEVESPSRLSELGVTTEANSVSGREVPPEVPDREYPDENNDGGGVSVLEFAVHMERTDHTE